MVPRVIGKCAGGKSGGQERVARRKTRKVVKSGLIKLGRRDRRATKTMINTA